MKKVENLQSPLDKPHSINKNGEKRIGKHKSPTKTMIPKASNKGINRTRFEIIKECTKTGRDLII